MVVWRLFRTFAPVMRHCERQKPETMNLKYATYLLMLFAATMAFACGGEDDEQAQPEQVAMPMFRMSELTGKPFPEDSLETHAQGNSVHLHWFAVSNCAGYEIMYALRDSIAGNDSLWANPNMIVERFTVSPEKTDTIIEGLQYATDYSFAIRALSVAGDTFHSNWFGIGDSRQWAEQCHRMTEDADE